MLHFWCQGAAPLVPGCCTFYWHYYSQVFTVAFLLAKSFDFRLILIVPWNSIIGFPSGRRTLFLHSSFFQQPQAFTLANPFRIPLHREKQRSKKSVVKDSVCICAIRELFLTFVL